MWKHDRKELTFYSYLCQGSDRLGSPNWLYHVRLENLVQVEYPSDK